MNRTIFTNLKEVIFVLFSVCLGALSRQFGRHWWIRIV